ncbi:MAG: sulfur carrier protein ThiS [Ruminococcus sp.]|nr:sulfur carrier protein ThiS [Ruminococcus sp.]
MVLINGKNTSADGKTVSQYLEEANFNPQTIAVELNEDILPKPQYGETVLKDGDVLEVVSFMGGG